MLVVLDGELQRIPHRDAHLDMQRLNAPEGGEEELGGELRLLVSTRAPGSCHSMAELSTKLCHMGLQAPHVWQCGHQIHPW